MKKDTWEKEIDELTNKELKERIEDLEISIDCDQAELDDCNDELKKRKLKKKK